MLVFAKLNDVALDFVDELQFLAFLAPDLVPVMLASDWLELVRTRTGTRTGGFTLTVFNRSITSTRPGA